MVLESCGNPDPLILTMSSATQVQWRHCTWATLDHWPSPEYVSSFPLECGPREALFQFWLMLRFYTLNTVYLPTEAVNTLKPLLTGLHTSSQPVQSKESDTQKSQSQCLPSSGLVLLNWNILKYKDQVRCVQTFTNNAFSPHLVISHLYKQHHHPPVMWETCVSFHVLEHP